MVNPTILHRQSGIITTLCLDPLNTRKGSSLSRPQCRSSNRWLPWRGVKSCRRLRRTLPTLRDRLQSRDMVMVYCNGQEMYCLISYKGQEMHCAHSRRLRIYPLSLKPKPKSKTQGIELSNPLKPGRKHKSYNPKTLIQPFTALGTVMGDTFPNPSIETGPTFYYIDTLNPLSKPLTLNLLSMHPKPFTNDPGP